MLEQLTGSALTWFPERGIGYYPVDQFPYDENYFAKYRGYESTDLGEKITQARVAFVGKHYNGLALDVGVGSGHFVRSRKGTLGYDVNETAVAWLRSRGAYVDLYSGAKFDALMFWDSLEHIKEPEKAIDRSRRWVFLSIPIFKNLDDLLTSKHFRKDEHFWYFTHNGLCAWFSENGFDLVDKNDVESYLGRDGIYTYAFKRRNA